MSEHVTFHRDGEVSVNRVRVGAVRGVAHAWHFAPADRPVSYGPYRNRTSIRTLAREAYQRIEKAREL